MILSLARMRIALRGLPLLLPISSRNGAEDRSNAMSVLEAVIFDLDGVVVDSHPAHLKAWIALFCWLDVDVPDDEMSFILEGQDREDSLRHFLGELTPE